MRYREITAKDTANNMNNCDKNEKNNFDDEFDINLPPEDMSLTPDQIGFLKLIINGEEVGGVSSLRKKS